MLMALSVSKVKQASGDEGGSAVGQDFAESHRDQGQRPVGRQLEVDLGVTQDLQGRSQRLRREAEAEAVFGALVWGKVGGLPLRAPRARIGAGRLHTDDLHRL